MKIQYLGHASFILRTKDATLITDPFDPEMTGLKFPKLEADIITVSHDHKDHNQVQLVGGKPKVFDFPGEYESKGIRFYGFQTYHDESQGGERGENVIFKILMDGLVLVHCGDLGHMPSNEVLAQIEDADILFVPVGGTFTLDAKKAKEFVDKISPSIIVPMHYKTDKLNAANFGMLQEVSEFLKLSGIEQVETKKIFEVKTDTLPEKEIVVFES